jgi:hypothetical protein
MVVEIQKIMSIYGMFKGGNACPEVRVQNLTEVHIKFTSNHNVANAADSHNGEIFADFLLKNQVKFNRLSVRSFLVDITELRKALHQD